MPEEPTRPLRILFSMRNYWYVRHFDTVIRMLVDRGHSVHLLAERATNEHAPDWREAADALVADVPHVTYGYAPRADRDDWYDLRIMLRLGLDYARFTRPEYDGLDQLVDRARSRTPSLLRAAAESPLGRAGLGRALLTRVLGVAERSMPPDPALRDSIASYAPDLVVVTPLVELGSEQADVVRIARQLRIPTVLCVGSWDHLSSKGLIRTSPDRVIVWNDTQRSEAIRMHHVAPACLEVTGAQLFDHWFGRAPTLDRAAFCRKVGLDPARPFVLYVCSALFEGSPREAGFVERWIAALRASDDERLRGAGVLIRPHPKRAMEWTGLEHRLPADVVTWPPQAEAPITRPSQSDYFDSMFHSAAVVGLNTSALIEAGIVGRPVLTILEPEFSGSQEGTLHFRYLLEGGLLRVARAIDDHLPQLASALRVTGDDPQTRQFIERFVRPHGYDQAATPRVVDAIERAATVDPATLPTIAPRLVRATLRPLAALTAGRFAEQVGRARRRHARAAARAQVQAERERARAARLDEKARAMAAHRAAKAERERAAKRAARAERASAQATRAREHAGRLERHRRDKQREALRARLAAMWRTVTGRSRPSV